MNSIKGNCHCSEVIWSFSTPITTVVKCHCGNCRKLQGSDYSTWIVIPETQYEICQGEDRVTKYETEDSQKNFCSVCGSPVYLINGKHFPEDVIVALGCVEDYNSELAPQIQVYTPDKAEWVNLHEDEPIFS